MSDAPGLSAQPGGGPPGGGVLKPPPGEVKNLTVRAVGDLSRNFVLSVRNGDGKGLACAGVVICTAPGPVKFNPGDVMELGVTVLPGPVLFGGATYQVGYQIVP
jgi:hypothetical protein